MEQKSGVGIKERRSRKRNMEKKLLANRMGVSEERKTRARGKFREKKWIAERGTQGERKSGDGDIDGKNTTR